MKKSFLVLIMFFASCLCLPACGYSTKTSLPAHIKTIAVLPFANKIDFQSGKPNVYVPLLEVKSHDAVINQFLFDGNLRIVDEKAADLVLKGELINYDRSALRFTDNNDVQEYRITITVRLTMLDGMGQVMWEEPSFSGEDTYFLTGPNATSEAGAIEDAIKDLAKRIVERTVEDW
jgi:outer membrane lipopolysaccharide assembly protein LptE/RlpB